VTWLEITQGWDGGAALAAERARVGLSWQGADLAVRVEAPDHGDPPPPSPPGHTPGLWDYEVVELFLCGPGDVYLELELGPAGHHLVLLLHGVRKPRASPRELDVVVNRGAGRWTAGTTLPQAWLPPRPWRANAYAIHGCGPDRRYLACHPVPGDGPDFHRLQHFKPLALEAP